MYSILNKKKIEVPINIKELYRILQLIKVYEHVNEFLQDQFHLVEYIEILIEYNHVEQQLINSNLMFRQ